MRTWEGINLSAIQDPQTRDAFFIVNRFLAQLSPAAGNNSGQGDVSVPTVKELDTFTLANKAIPIAGVTAVPGQVKILRVDSIGQLLVSAILSGGTVDTELPAAALLADGVANPTTPVIAAYIQARDTGGTAYSRLSHETEAEAGSGNASDRGLHASPLHKFDKPDVSDFDATYHPGVATAVTVTDIDVRRFNSATWQMGLSVTSVPTDIRFELWESIDGGATYQKRADTFWADNRLDDTAVAAQGSRSWSFDIKGIDFLELRIVTSGTVAAPERSFTVADSKLGLRAT